MKLNRFFMLGLAGLAFAACSNEEEPGINNRFPDGTGAVTVKLINPALTRAIETPTDGTAGTTTIAITGDLTVSLYEAADVTDGEPNPGVTPKMIVIDAAQVEDDTELKFCNSLPHSFVCFGVYSHSSVPKEAAYAIRFTSFPAVKSKK